MAGITQSTDDAKQLLLIHNWVDLESLGSIYYKWCLILPLLAYMILKVNAKLYFHKKSKCYKSIRANKQQWLILLEN